MWIVLWSVVICCGFVGLLIFFLSSGPVIDASFLQDLLPRPTLLSISQCTVMISVFLAGSFARPKIQPLLDTAQTLFVEQTKKWQRQRWREIVGTVWYHGIRSRWKLDGRMDGLNASYFGPFLNVQHFLFLYFPYNRLYVKRCTIDSVCVSTFSYIKLRITRK